MTGVVSFSLFGQDEEDIYIPGAFRNCEMYNDLRPEWHLKFYVGESITTLTRRRLLKFRNVTVVPMDLPETRAATYWRFLAVKDGGYDFYLSRDTDSRPFKREISAVNEWLESDKWFHVMRDHPRHGAPMLAGMWGVKEEGAAKIRRRFRAPLVGDYYQIDQDWLKNRVWKFAKRSVMAHVDCEWDFGMESVPFSVPRKDFDYVAECYNGDDTLRFPEHRLEVALYGYHARDDVPSQDTSSIHPRSSGRAVQNPSRPHSVARSHPAG